MTMLESEVSDVSEMTVAQGVREILFFFGGDEKGPLV